ncbi:hypothetical protein CA237_01320 [Sphingomonas sp. ABOLH]|nr:MAG: hypothetical protein DI625_06335 [Sphingomonas sp.]RSV33155.1 hypothetical protein CA237_01320 [Sphingomonas sp. ABOLH]
MRRRWRVCRLTAAPVRHSREGGNPLPPTFALKPLPLRIWIPACAGMTGGGAGLTHQWKSHPKSAISRAC